MPVLRVVPDLPAADPRAVAASYAAVLGLEVVMDQGWIVTLAAPGDLSAQIGLVAEDASAPVRPDLSVEVDDVDAVHAEAVRAGWEVLHPLTDEPWGVRRFFARAPGGAVVNVLAHR